MRTTTPTLCFAIFCLIASALSAQELFVENGKQWPDQVAFKTDIPGGQFYAEKDGFTVNLYDTEATSRVFAVHSGNGPGEAPPEYLQCHAYKVHFEGVQPNTPPPDGRKAARGSYNFFLGDEPSRWSGGLKGYEEVYYEGLYPGIDLKLYRRGSLKYDFIVQPGADPSLIQLRYEGVKPRNKPTGELLLRTAVGEVIESRPFAYQINGSEIITVDCQYKLSRSGLSFELGDYRKELPLIIDPELVFSTYSGSTANNFGFSATYDAEGHLYAGSSIFGQGYPVTLGAYQSNWAGGSGAGSLTGTDIAITKFSLDGTDLVYSTYLGGSGDELPHSLIADEEGRLYVLGTTGSADFPTASGAVQSSFAGGAANTLTGVGINYTNGCDMVITAFNPQGTALFGSTFVGGSENDGLNTASTLAFNYADEMRGEIEIDAEGNIVVGSSTLSNDFPVTSGAYQSSNAGGQDGVVFRLNPQLTELLASTYYGGSGDDAVYSIDIAEGGLLIGGGTQSSNLPMAGTSFQSSYAGGPADGFMANLSHDMDALLAASYYGSSAYDQIYFVERDGSGFPHIYGQTTAGGNTFISNADFGIPNSGMLISKFSPDLSERLWSTVFGDGDNKPNLSPSAFSVDICNRIYLSGWGGQVNTNPDAGNTNGLPLTDDALQSSTDGSDFYFLVMEGDASGLNYASYLGGNQSAEHVDGGTSRFDRSGKIYQAVCAGCGGNDDFPTFPENAWSSVNNSSCNLAVAKIDFDLPLVLADFSVETACLPAAVEFTNTSVSGSASTSFIWDFGDGNSSLTPSPSHNYENPGVYEVSLVVWDPLSCNLGDTATLTIEVFPALDLQVETEVFSCTDTSFTLTASTNGQALDYIWATDQSLQNILLQGSNDSVLTFNSSVPTSLYILVTAGPCESAESIAIIPPPIASILLEDTLLCSLDTLTAQAILLGAGGFEMIWWEPQEAIVAGQGSSEASFLSDSSFTITVSAISEFDCVALDSARVSVFPTSLQAPPDTLTCDDGSIELVANSFGTAEIFLWSDQSDFSNILNADGDSIVSVSPAGFSYFYIQAINGPCSLVDSVAIASVTVGAVLSGPNVVCEGDTVSFTVANVFPGIELVHHWEPEELLLFGQGSNMASFVLHEATTVSVSSTTEDGDCLTENEIFVETSPLGSIDFTVSAQPKRLPRGGSSLLSVVPAIEGYSYLWQPPTYLDSNQGTEVWSTPDESITYQLTILDADSAGACSKTYTVSLTVVDVECDEPFIYVPNAFSPNGDGENDVLYVRGSNIERMRFVVYDRWGEMVFESRDPAQGWDGTYKGRLAAPAVFVYHLEVDCGDGESFFTKGNVSLLR